MRLKNIDYYTASDESRMVSMDDNEFMILLIFHVNYLLGMSGNEARILYTLKKDFILEYKAAYF